MFSVCVDDDWAFFQALWAQERSTHWWDNIVNSHFISDEWLKNFCVSNDTFLYLCEQLRPSISKSDTIMRKAIPTEQVAITLWYLSTGSDYRTIGHLSVRQSQLSVLLLRKSAQLYLPQFSTMYWCCQWYPYSNNISTTMPYRLL